MWVMTPRGFYSAVQKRNDPLGEITVRARCREDLENLGDLLPNAQPYQFGGSDYPWRIKVPIEEWEYVCSVFASEVDYDNFKDEVRRVQGKERASVYSSVWVKLLGIESDADRARYSTAWGGYDYGYGLKTPLLPAPKDKDEEDAVAYWELQEGKILDLRHKMDEEARAQRKRQNKAKNKNKGKRGSRR